MSKYTWDIDLLRRHRKELEIRLRKAKTKEEKEYIADCLDSYFLLFLQYESRSLTEEEFLDDSLDKNPQKGFDEIKADVLSAKFFYERRTKDLFLNIIQGIKIDFNIPQLPMSHNLIEVDSSIKYCLDFFRSLDYEMFEKIRYMYNPKNRLLHVNSGFGKVNRTCFNTQNQKPYVHITDDKTIYSPSAFVHEGAHGIEYLFNSGHYFDANYLVEHLSEVFSIFCEFINYPFLVSVGIDEKEINALELFYFECFIDDCGSVSKLFNMAKTGMRKIDKVVKRSDIKLEVQEEFGTTLDNFISYLVALQLRAQYLQDKDLAVYNIKRFMCWDKRDDIDAILEGIGVDLYNSVEYVNEYAKELKLKNNL